MTRRSLFKLLLIAPAIKALRAAPTPTPKRRRIADTCESVAGTPLPDGCIESRMMAMGRAAARFSDEVILQRL